jgi:hypothetical protein
MTDAAPRTTLHAAAAAAGAMAVRAGIALLLAALVGPRRGSLAPGLLGQVVMAVLAVAFAM